jgi:hypothetical protein
MCAMRCVGVSKLESERALREDHRDSIVQAEMDQARAAREIKYVYLYVSLLSCACVYITA